MTLTEYLQTAPLRPWLELCADKQGDCETQIARGEPWCQHEQRYIVDIYSPGMKNWRLLRICAPCADRIRSGGFRYRLMQTIPDDLRGPKP